MMFTGNQKQVFKYAYIPAIGFIITSLFFVFLAKNLELLRTKSIYLFGLLEFWLFILLILESVIQKDKVKIITRLILFALSIAFLYFILKNFCNPTQGLFLIISFINPIQLLGLVRGISNLSIKDALSGYIAGTLVLYICPIFGITALLEINDIVKLISAGIIGYVWYALVFTFDNLLNKELRIQTINELFSKNKDKSAGDFAVRFSILFLVYILLYTYLILGMPPKFSEIKNYMNLDFCITCILLLVTTILFSRVIIQRIVSLKYSVSWLYIVSFIPVINLYSFITLCGIKNSEIKEELKSDEKYVEYFKYYNSQLIAFITSIFIISNLVSMYIYIYSSFFLRDTSAV